MSKLTSSPLSLYVQTIVFIAVCSSHTQYILLYIFSSIGEGKVLLRGTAYLMLTAKCCKKVPLTVTQFYYIYHMNQGPIAVQCNTVEYITLLGTGLQMNIIQRTKLYIFFYLHTRQQLLLLLL